MVEDAGWRFPIQTPSSQHADGEKQKILDQRIATRRGIMCSHREPCYAEEKQRHELRQSELAQDHAILLPLYAQMTEDDQAKVSDALRRELTP
jgi:perosamine synthetase